MISLIPNNKINGGKKAIAVASAAVSVQSNLETLWAACSHMIPYLEILKTPSQQQGANLQKKQQPVTRPKSSSFGDRWLNK